MFSGSFVLHLSGALLTALTFTVAATYVVRAWARKHGYVDMPDNSRRIHAAPTPKIGGVAIAIVTTVTFVLWSMLTAPGRLARPEIVAMLLGGLMMFVVGFWDDTRHLGPWSKFALQLAIAVGVYMGGVRILGIHFGALWHGQLPTAVSVIITVVWIVGTTNAFNLIDGSDGVAAGAALFASATLGAIFALRGDLLGMLMAAILVGACMGFLFFNFPPASIFLGDSGSLFLGYTLATLGVITTQRSSTLIAVAIPVVAFGIPLLDTLMAIVRRTLRGQAIFRADLGHIHHRLRDLGHSPRSVAVTLYVGCAAFGALSLLLAAPGRTTVLPVFVVAAAVLIMAVQRLDVPELSELIRVVGRGFRQQMAISHNVRLRAACDALDAAGDADALLAALDEAFHGSEFLRFEAWLPRELAAPLLEAQVAHLHGEGPGYLLVISFEKVLNPRAEVEIRTRIWSEDDQEIGRLSLYRSVDGEHLYTDVRLLPQRLVPAFVGGLRRLAESPSGAASRRLRESQSIV